MAWSAMTLLGGVFATTAGATAPPSSSPGNPFGPLDAVIADRVLGDGNVSVSLAVARHGRIVHTATFGPADPARAAPATPATLYRVASVSKTFAALAVWRLVSEGRIALDVPVMPLIARSLPKVAVTDARVGTITTRELMNQSSGLPTAWGLYFAAKDAARSCPEAATRALSGRLVDDPGASYRYSNTNYCIVGLLIEAIVHEPFESYVSRAVLTPLGVLDAHVVRRPDDYHPGDAWHPAAATSASLGALGAAGEWVATPTDLVQVFDTLARPACGSPYPSSALLTTRPGPWVKPTDASWYGLGLMVWDGGAAWGHSGTIEGGRAIVEHDADGTTWAITVSGTRPRTGEDLRDLVRDGLDRLPANGGRTTASECRPIADRMGPR